jgi:hypothetical protein
MIAARKAVTQKHFNPILTVMDTKVAHVSPLQRCITQSRVSRDESNVISLETQTMNWDVWRSGK